MGRSQRNNKEHIMTTYVRWPPTIREDSFPKNFFPNDPLDLYWPDIQLESCSTCGFTVEWIMDKDEYSNWNEITRRRVNETLTMQRDKGDCPSHPKPSWL